MTRRISFYWGDGYVVCSLVAGDLELRASNTLIVFEPRGLYVDGLFESIREYVVRDGKIVYVDLAFPIKGVKGVGSLYSRDVDTYLGPYGLVYTVIEGLGYYLTIYPPPGALYEYAVVAKNIIMLKMSPRREVYIMTEETARRLILV